MPQTLERSLLRDGAATEEARAEPAEPEEPPELEARTGAIGTGGKNSAKPSSSAKQGHSFNACMSKSSDVGTRMTGLL
eukprot:CAMPEP_0204016816 /NCGR_PEP_ID=MMETSP0360-20130528/26998_1 /ASSEMBLY_ACC=CAM_ASM_000342 /TAXON_ID=268821 /ORGANISM="Scrippsiella Hangoei, Strain SHTV-5" /LENGTH=77 /DNA_ID=CAMNT_0050959845 /DNA_START=103 /DNA_END=336 /DNA_ORIENTATION=-